MHFTIILKKPVQDEIISSFIRLIHIEGVKSAMQDTTQESREQALVRLMQVYGDSVKRMCCVYLRDLGVAEDAAQDTFLKAYEHIDQILSGEIRNEKAWLMRIAINT